MQQKKKKWYVTPLKVLGVVGAVAGILGIAYLAARPSNDDGDSYILLSDGNDDNYDDKEVYGLGKNKFPTCKSCDTQMTEFDGWAWYTCPYCGNSVRIIDGEEKWYDEIFGTGKKEHHSDYELADFCRGGDLSDD